MSMRINFLKQQYHNFISLAISCDQICKSLNRICVLVTWWWWAIVEVLLPSFLLSMLFKQNNHRLIPEKIQLLFLNSVHLTIDF